MNKIKKCLQSLIQDQVTPSEGPATVSFEGLGVILSKIGIFQNLEFGKIDEKLNRSSLSLNQNKVKPERLSQEV